MRDHLPSGRGAAGHARDGRPIIPWILATQAHPRAGIAGAGESRGVCALFLGDPQAAIPDLERAVNDDPEHDFHRAPGLLAHAFALTGRKDRAEALF